MNDEMGAVRGLGAATGTVPPRPQIEGPYAELRAALPDATPGPWTWDERGRAEALVIGPDGDSFVTVHMNLGLGSNPDRNARYIAAANPSVIAALLADRDRDRLREVAAATHAALAQLDRQAADGGGERGQVYATVQLWRDYYRPLMDELRAALRGSGEEAGRG